MRNAKIVMLPWLSEVAAISFQSVRHRVPVQNIAGQRVPAMSLRDLGLYQLMVYFLVLVFWSTIQNVRAFNLELLFPCVIFLFGPYLAGVLLQSSATAS